MHKIAVAGASGRMGRMVVREVYHNPQCELVSALARSGNPFVGQDIGILANVSPMGLELSDNLAKAVEAEVVIDFSKPEGTLALLEANASTPIVIAVTGFDNAQRHAIEAASKTTPILLAPNTSLGAIILKKAAREIAHSLGSDYDIEIFEQHHRNKVDAPSGTSKSIADSLAHVPGFHLNHSTDRDGHRERGAIHITASRGGGVIADHNVSFLGENEVITISHHAIDRSLFAQGALRAALWLIGKVPGLYTMEDVISL